MLYFLLFLIFLALAAIADQIRLLRVKETEDFIDDTWETKEEKIPFSIKIKEILKKSDNFLNMIGRSFKEAVKEIKQVKVRK